MKCFIQREERNGNNIQKTVSYAVRLERGISLASVGGWIQRKHLHTAVPGLVCFARIRGEDLPGLKLQSDDIAEFIPEKSEGE